MYSFTNDYSEGAHPRILQTMMEANLTQNKGYGLDIHSGRARDLIRKEIRQQEADVHFIPGGTQTNLIVIASALRPYQAVISAVTGHVNVHETGAVEATGHKVLAMDTADGKLTPALINQALEAHADEHMVQPKMVYISNSTEVGTQYSKAELEALSRICRLKGLYLFLDGARLGAALTSPANDLTLSDIAALTDVFYIGGTKNGALLGEAVVILREDLKTDFRFMIKQRGAMMAKGWLLGIQFEELFRNNLFYDMARHANQMAGRLREAIAGCGWSFAWDSRTNQLFPVFSDQVIRELEKDFSFDRNKRVDESHSCIRLVTSWATTEEGVEAFIEAIKKLS